ncbi:diaminopimelate decarboxylase [Carnobacteriaceae bacterium zg-ZUI240]|nr:diaminopimelate decarboxylase [Carnobacteriaceae bacterium zg-ZUI240]
MQLHGTATINELGHLTVGGVDTTELAKAYGTPLMIYDEALIREQCRRFHRVLEKSGLHYHVSYASKAFMCKAIVRIMQEENMGLDVVSIGELFNALSADFNPKNIHLHGNNKTIEELRFALDKGIGCIVIDSFDEISRLNQLAMDMKKTPNCLLRVTPGVEAHTHEFISTGSTDSKFGLNIDNGQAFEAVKAILDASHLNLIGLHFHIGSQIFGTDGTRVAIDKVFQFFDVLKNKLDFTAQVLNIGGGFGIRYTKDDLSYPIETALEEIVESLKNAAEHYHLPIPQLWLEPGRSIVGEAGYTIYSIGTIKRIPDVRTYVSIDGGMSDHIRTALYGAKYEVALANRMNDKLEEVVTFAGKCCESGDMIAYDIEVPTPQINDLAVVSCTGAYHYAMASNYNQMLRPAVVLVKDGHHKLAIKRETLEDIIKNQL